MDVKGSDRSGEKRIKVKVVSLAPGGHWRAGKFWIDNQSTGEVTEAELAELKGDKRIVLIDDTAPSADSILARIKRDKAEQTALAKAALDKASRK